MSRKRETKCPVKSCGALRYDLSRHMHPVHHWPDAEAKNVKALYGLRAKYTRISQNKVPKFKDYHRHKQCPFDGCRAVVLVLSRHLQHVHKLDKSCVECKSLLNSAIAIDPVKTTSKPKQTNASANKQPSLTSLLTPDADLVPSETDDESSYCASQSLLESSQSSQETFINDESSCQNSETEPVEIDQENDSVTDNVSEGQGYVSSEEDMESEEENDEENDEYSSDGTEDGEEGDKSELWTERNRTPSN